MKTQKNILIAFILNLAFSVFELIGGLFTGSVAILSDAIHDIGDAASIGMSYFFERTSKKQPDNRYTYGYARFSVLGSAVTTMILLLSSAAVIFHAIGRIMHPTAINYNGMILFAVVGLLVNGAAAFVTREGDSLNQKAVNLHMLEDVLGWAVVLLGAIVMRFTDFTMIDPIMSIGIGVFIIVNAFGNLKEILDLFLVKTPQGTDVNELAEHICHIDGVLDVHHIHIWSIDGTNRYATMHIVTNEDTQRIKAQVREELSEHGICHATLELEAENEPCSAVNCHVEEHGACGHHHHHHHHH
ncbi:MAG: cation transporter [Oscillospiraceae bacterium]|nr:cation transporter [Oscillospiraceae bacterium]